VLVCLVKRQERASTHIERLTSQLNCVARHDSTDGSARHLNQKGGCNMKVKVSGVIMVLCLTVLILSCANTASAQTDKPITLSVLSSWPKGYPEVDDYVLPWIAKIESATGGRLKLRWMGGPEAVHPFEQLKAVQKGLTDILYTHPAYHPEVVAAGQAADLVYAVPKVRTESGYDTLLAEVYLKRGGVKYLPPFPSGMQYQLFMNKKIDKADLTGLKIRATPFYVPMVAGLGGATVQTTTGEIYDSLSSGVIDGYCSPQRYPMTIKLHEVTKYAVLPRVGEVVFISLVNTSSWNKVPKDLQATVEKVTREVVEAQRAVMLKKTKEEEPRMLQHGMAFVQLPPQESSKMLKVFRDRSWETLIFKPDPEFAPKLKAIAEKIEQTK